MDNVERLFRQGDDNLEGCIGALEAILMSELVLARKQWRSS
jgi:hypothetical protein